MKGAVGAVTATATGEGEDGLGCERRFPAPRSQRPAASVGQHAGRLSGPSRCSLASVRLTAMRSLVAVPPARDGVASHSCPRALDSSSTTCRTTGPSSLPGPPRAMSSSSGSMRPLGLAHSCRRLALPCRPSSSGSSTAGQSPSLSTSTSARALRSRTIPKWPPRSPRSAARERAACLPPVRPPP